MLKTINQKESLASSPNEGYFLPKVQRCYSLMLSSKTRKGYAGNIAKEVVSLIQALGSEALLFIGEAEIRSLYQENDQPTERSSLPCLSEKKIGRKFTGRFEIPSNELPSFLTDLILLMHCNATAPVVNFLDKDKHFTGSICKHGNIHFFTLDKKCDTRLSNALRKSSFAIIQEDKCYDQFAKTAPVKEKETLLLGKAIPILS